MAAALRTHGFQVINGLDLDKTALERKIREFANALQGAEVGVFFYAGHGLQVSGQNYIVPIDARLTTLAALELEVMRFEAVQRIMENEDRTNILFFDACRDNPLARNLQQAMGTRSMAIGRGLAEIQTGQGTLISYSTAPGNVALDGAGRNSPFTGALIRHLSSSNEEIMGLLRDVRNDVLRETQRRQRPWESSGLTERFYFSGPPNANLPAPVRPQANLSAPVRPQPNQAERAGSLAAAKELVAVKGGNALYGPLVPGIIERAKSIFLQANPLSTRTSTRSPPSCVPNTQRVRQKSWTPPPSFTPRDSKSRSSKTHWLFTSHRSAARCLLKRPGLPIRASLFTSHRSAASCLRKSPRFSMRA
jgi:hypothetical protein